MSLRNSPELTPELLAAKRAAAQCSTGPRTPAGKQHSKLNALKHGLYAAPENESETMRALGEDPAEFEAMQQELMTTYGPGDALWARQIDDLTRLYWRRRRLERAQNGLLCRAVQPLEEAQQRRRAELAAVTFGASQPEILELSTLHPTDPGVRMRKLLSLLELVRAQVKQRVFRHRQRAEIEVLYESKGWRQARLLDLLGRFIESFAPGAKPPSPALLERWREEGRLPEPAEEPQYQELLRLLEEEIAAVQSGFQYEEKLNQEKARFERDAALAPVGEVWSTLLKQLAALDRSIDRKVRILLALRKDAQRANSTSPPPKEEIAATLAGIAKASQADAPSEEQQASATVEDKKSKERTLNVVENKGPACKSPEASSSVGENTGRLCQRTSDSEDGKVM
jgi:hypothetical protein